MRRHRHCAIALCFATIAACRSPQPDGYATRLALALRPDSDGMRGRLELLEDARIRPEMREAIGDAFGGDPCAETPAAVLRALCAGPHPTPLRPARLRLVDESGRVVDARTAERPLADLAVARLYDSPRRTYLFTVDLSAGIGSYSGPLTRLAEPARGAFGWVMASDSSGAQRDTLTLVSTLKTGWRAVPRADGQGQDLLMFLCRPDLEATDGADAFLLTFERFAFDGQRWVRKRRRERGCWEDGPFPPRDRFP